MYSRTVLLLSLLAGAASAQGTNCVLLGTMNNHPNYNDIWGYVAPNGHEYALQGCQSGTAVIDTTIPTAPVERGFFPGPNSTWRDIRTYQHYAYVVTEGGGGFQIIDLQNPDQPVLLGTFGAAQFNNAHNVCIDLGTGRLYAIGCNTGTPVFDLAANPTNPPFVGYAGAGGQSNYFHDLQVENGRGYGSMIYNGVLRVMDVTTFPPTTLSNAPTPGNFTHNAWPNAAGTVCVTTDEVSGGVLDFFDTTNPAAPVSLSTFRANPTSTSHIPHNAYIVGTLCHVSWYTEGYRCIDISDPRNPVEVASYDTWPGASSGYNGAWGCYPFQPSGNVYVNDISTGLYIVRPQITDLAIAHTPLANTTNEDGPYPVRATVTTSNSLQSVSLVWSVNGGAATTSPMTPTANPNEYGFDIPGQYAPSTVRYHVVAADSVGTRTSPPNGDHSFFVGVLQQVFFDDVETDLGWSHGMVATQDDWQRGNSAGLSGTSGGAAWADAPAAYSGSFCWGNDLGGPGFNGAYQNNVSNWLQSPSIPTNGVQGLHLRYRRWISLAVGDVGNVMVNGNLVAQVPANTRDTAWQWIDHDISAIANSAPVLTLRFELVTNGSTVAGGWTIDDIEIYQESDCVPAAHYGAGTPGTGGLVPQIGLVGVPRVGQTFGIECTNALGGAGCLLVLGLQPTSVPAFGVTVLVDPATAVGRFAIANGSPGVAGAGSAVLNITLPNNAALDDLDAFAQFGVLDAGSPGGVMSATDGMRVRVCRL